VLAYHWWPHEGGRDTVVGGRYLDWMEKIGADWRIAKRTMIYDWLQDLRESMIGDRWTPRLEEATE